MLSMKTPLQLTVYGGDNSFGLMHSIHPRERKSFLATLGPVAVLKFLDTVGRALRDIPTELHTP